MTDMIKFYRGELANLPVAGDIGAIYITTDEGAIYYGTGDGMKKLGDYILIDKTLLQSGAVAEAKSVGDKFAEMTIKFDDYYLKSEADTLHKEVLDYVDEEIAALVNSAPETLDTLGELAIAFEENEEVVNVLNEAIATRVKTINNVGVDGNGNIDVREVPEVTGEDNGKFLVVVNGAWAATQIDSAEEMSF